MLNVKILERNVVFVIVCVLLVPFLLIDYFFDFGKDGLDIPSDLC